MNTTLIFVDFKKRQVNAGHIRSQLINDLYSRITSKLTLKQFESTIGGSMKYTDKLVKVRRVTKNRDVLALCDQLETILKVSA